MSNDDFSYLGNTEINTIEALYKSWQADNTSVDPTWHQFFRGFDFARAAHTGLQQSGLAFEKEFQVLDLIHGYRQRGHFFTRTNPVRARRKYHPTLAIENFGLTDNDLDTVFHAGNNIGIGAASLRDIVAHLEQTYCQSVGVEYVFIRKPEMVEWLQKRMESVRNTATLSPEQKKHIFFHLKLAVGFETFIHRRFVGQKRFSLEGAESVIPALDAVIEKGAELGIREFVIGMPHRGRLNVLAHTLRKPYEDIFREFTGTDYDDEYVVGDVKYHLGYDNEVITDKGKKVKLILVPNPSHLEAASPVAEGITRARLEHLYNKDENQAATILLHGDAAIAAQGVVYEVIQMSQLAGYQTGGTIHLVINNQVGFTTNYLDARSSTYCTDVAKVTRSPVFHVNGDDVEALIYTITLAMEYRQRFHTDVFIDLLCYRRYGHNEGDEPRFTQPVLYKAIASHPNTRDIYAKELVKESHFSEEDINQAINDFNEILEQKLEKSKQATHLQIRPFLRREWDKIRHADDNDFRMSPTTAVDETILKDIALKINTLPEGKPFFTKIQKIVEDRQNLITQGRVDWALGELLAYGTLLSEGFPIRISGQDCERGTFSHRHAAFTYDDSEEKYFALKNIAENQAPFHIYNSLLSEYGVLGFEYGYAMATPDALTIWEAQFGDFHNVAQVIIDQYISSAERKWGVRNGLVLLLPHGYEGQGPEHSSARIERFLQLSVSNNMQIVNCTTPANMFHALRRQLHREVRVPLVAFTPKSLLRHPQCVSPLSDLSRGGFQEVIDDDKVATDQVSRLVFCSGKIYYDLLAEKERLNAWDVALIRIEQLHPFPYQQITQIIKKYAHALAHLWVQEEPENMGAWWYLQNVWQDEHLICVSREASSSPATGLHHIHQTQQQEIVGKVFRTCDCELKNHYCALQCVKGKSRAEIKMQYQYLFE